MTNKLLVVSVDAMHMDDIEFARTLPGFSWILEHASIAEIEGIFPSLTYPNHAAQITGCPPASTGIYNNVQFKPGVTPTEWFWDSRLLQVPTIFAAAREAGLTTAAIQWPVTANDADVDWLVPEIASPHLFGGMEDQYRQTTNPASFERYVLPNLHRIRTDGRPGRYLDFVDHVSAEVLRHERPDVMFVHLVAVDFVRHEQGANGPHVHEALRRVDDALVRYRQMLTDTGDLERTDIVIVSDHGQLDTEQFTNLNAIFRRRGFLRTDDDGALLDYDVLCLSAGLSAQLFLADDIAPGRRREVEQLLVEIEADPQYRVEKFWSAAQTRRDYGLDGPFTWVVETEPAVAVSSDWNGRDVVLRTDADYRGKTGSHGHAPRHGGQPVFIATGPSIVPGMDLGRRSMLDEAPTFAHLMGLSLPRAEGRVIWDVVKASAPART